MNNIDMRFPKKNHTVSLFVAVCSIHDTALYRTKTGDIGSYFARKEHWYIPFETVRGCQLWIQDHPEGCLLNMRGPLADRHLTEYHHLSISALNKRQMNDVYHLLVDHPRHYDRKARRDGYN